MEKQISVGQLIENEVRRQQIPIVEFAKRICCRRNNVYDIFKRNRIDIVLLKQISKVLHRNFFKEIAENMDLIIDTEQSEEDVKKRKAVSQFFDVVPDVLHRLGKSAVIVFCKLDGGDEGGTPTPDFGLPDYLITFTIGETLKERIGDRALLPITSEMSGDGCVVEICTNVLYGSTFINIKLDYKTAEEWARQLAFAFEAHARYVRK